MNQILTMFCNKIDTYLDERPDIYTFINRKQPLTKQIRSSEYCTMFYCNGFFMCFADWARARWQRLLWVVIVCAGFTLGVTLISDQIVVWLKSPTKLSIRGLDAEEIVKIPYPSLTLCRKNSYRDQLRMLVKLVLLIIASGDILNTRTEDKKCQNNNKI